MKSYPLVDLRQTNTPVFWVYNNLAYVYREYENSLNRIPVYIYGDEHKKPKLNTDFKIIHFPNSELKYFEDETFTWVLEFYYTKIERNADFKYNNFSPFAIECFSVQYDLKELDVEYDLDEYDFGYDLGKKGMRFEQWVSEMSIYDYEKYGYYPDSEQLDILVKEYLKNVKPDWENPFISNKDFTSLDKNRIYHFFEYHFKSYEGSVYDFINHCDRIIDKVWNDESSQNLTKQKYFDEWKTEKVIEYNLDRSKLGLEPIATPKPQQPIANNKTEKIKVLCDPATFGHIISELFEKQYIDLPKRNGDLNFSSSAKMLLNIFDINTTPQYLANCLNENKNSLSDYNKKSIDIKLYESKNRSNKS
ncbi:MAG: hypothetical protein MUF58_04835 [Arcicella sp.]|jgi:hypothetical protein|nr:hypothetical protein [Arcicella sp.]